MELLVISTLLFSCVGIFAYQFSSHRMLKQIHLPVEIRGQQKSQVGFQSILNVPTQFIERITSRVDLPIEGLRRKLISAGRPMNYSQFLAVKLLLAAALPVVVLIALQPKPVFLMSAALAGFGFPEIWLSGKVKKRQTEILRELPHVIDLLNICVGAGLDFMVAVNRVVQEFRPCALVSEMRSMVQEIHMGSSRREALRNLAARVNSTEMISFVRTLLQADRMGTPISDALKMQSEEIRIRRFQKGEEAALKAPVKLLFPLLVFIMPVVLIIIAGPIILQFTRGGMMKF